MPDVSVVVPTHNRVTMLLQTLRSVLAQDADIEVIVVDEGSTDGTGTQVAALSDTRVRIVRHERAQGLPRARNAGLAAATAEVVAFTDDDDLWLPGKLPAQLEAMRADGAPWAVAGAFTFMEGPRLLAVDVPPAPGEVVRRLPWVNVVPGGGSNAIVARDVALSVGGFDPELPTLEDWDMWIRLSRVGAPAVVAEPLVAYRQHGGGMSRRISAMLAGAETISERYRPLRGGEPLDWTDLYRWLAGTALRTGDRRAARRLRWRAFRAGHPGAGRALLRTLLPVAPRLPVSRPGEEHHWLDRVRPRPVVPWPPGVHTWLSEQLAA